MVDGSDAPSAEKSLDVTRSVVIAKLSNSLYEELPDSFNNTIYGLLEKAFSMPKDAVERIIKYPQLNAEEKEFACKCLVSFRSRVHKHRVIAQKAKLDAPTTIEAITEIPKEILEAEEELEVADEYTGDEEEIVNGSSVSDEDALLGISEQKPEDIPSEIDSVFHTADSAENGVCIEPESECAPTDVGDTAASFIEDATKIGLDETIVSKPPESSKFVEYDEDESVVPEEDKQDISMEIDKEALQNGAAKPDANSSETKDLSAENGCILDVKDIEQRSEELNGTTDDSDPKKPDASTDQAKKKKSLPPLCSVDNHKEHFMTLPVSWDGAPEFQWRTVHTATDRRTLIIENVFWSDISNVWLYPVILRAADVQLTFQKRAGEVKESPGKLDLKFVDDAAISSCAINYLVHVRTTRARRLKIFLPQTKVAVRLKNELEERLGRVREPSEVMCQVIVKPIEDSVTEEQIREVSFKNYRIRRVELCTDALNQRCAVVTFENADVAVAAHLANEYVHFGDCRGARGWFKVFYPYVMMRQSGADGLLTKWEYKKFTSIRGKNAKADNEKEKLPQPAVEVDSLETASEGGKEDKVAEVNSKKVHDTEESEALSKDSKKPIKQKSGQKRDFQPPTQSRSPPVKKIRRDSFGAQKSSQFVPTRGRRGVPFVSQVGKGRPRMRGKRGKRQFRGGLQSIQSAAKPWRPSGMDRSEMTAHSDTGIPAPLLSREDYKALSFPSHSQPLRSFPKKGGKPRGAMENSGPSRSSLGYKRGGSRPQFRSVRSSHEVVDPEILMEERIREQRKQLALQEELLRRRMLSEMDHAPSRSGPSARYGNSSSLGYSRSSVDYLDDGYGRGLESVGDLPHARPGYEMRTSFDRDPWTSYSDYPNGFSEREGRSADRSSYERSRQSDSYGSVWR